MNGYEFRRILYVCYPITVSSIFFCILSDGSCRSQDGSKVSLTRLPIKVANNTDIPRIPPLIKRWNYFALLVWSLLPVPLPALLPLSQVRAAMLDKIWLIGSAPRLEPLTIIAGLRSWWMEKRMVSTYDQYVQLLTYVACIRDNDWTRTRSFRNPKVNHMADSYDMMHG